MELLCPICGKTLQQKEKNFRCPEGHSYDVARQGYLNLLVVQQKHSLHPGDTREQVLSRREFLEGGFYAPLVEAVQSAAVRHGGTGPILDVGCGEGYYGSRVAEALHGELVGLDISKEAVRCAAGKYKNACWLCATASHLPVREHSAGVLMSMFALTMPEEFHRVLKKNGIFIQVLAAQDHLLGLKSVIYPQINLKEKNSVPELPGFRLEETVHVSFPFTVEGKQVQNLLSMTPHVFRISAEGAKRLEETQILTDRASCVVNVFVPV